MAYIKAEQVKEFRKEIKKAFPECKFSIRTRNHSTVDVTLLESPYSYEELFNVEFRVDDLRKQNSYFEGVTYEEAEEKAIEMVAKEKRAVEDGEFNLSINHFYLENYEGKAKDIFEKIHQIVNRGNHDNSDAMTDYFDVGWYTDFSIGNWDRGYRVAK